jgi:hypothetical protein
VTRADVERKTVGHLGRDGIEYPLTLKFDASDAIAVRAVFVGDGVTVDWHMSRALLKAGTVQAVGVGDVHVYPSFSRGVVVLILRSPDGSAELELSAKVVAEFLAATEEVVPLGAEAVDVDAALAQIFGVTS